MFTELQKIKQQWIGCRKCGLCDEGRHQVVFSDGPETAKIMIIGQNPGAIEDQKGIPFSGPAGQLMNKILASVNIARQECYWTNVTKCKSIGDRAPKVAEIAACKPLVLDEIKYVQPKVIILVGKPSCESLLGYKGAMGEIAGRWQEVQGIPALAIYHPAAILHTQNINHEQCMKYKKSVWESMKALRAFLDDHKEQEKVVALFKDNKPQQQSLL